MFNIFKSNTKEYEGKNFYSFSARNSNGEEIPMSSYLGKVCLVVNVASQYDETEPSALNFPTKGLSDENFFQLNELDKRYRDQGLVILGFPTNQFSGKEPVLQEEILSFIKRKYNVDFEIYEKLDVNGANTHPLFDYLKTVLTGTITNDLKWHFTKFLVDRNGNPVKRYAPNEPPFSFEEEIRYLLRQECVFKKGMEGQQLPESANQSSQMKQREGLETEKQKEVCQEGGERREHEEKKLQAGQTTVGWEKDKKEVEKCDDKDKEQWSKEKGEQTQITDKGDQGKLGEGGKIGAQMGIHIGEQKLQTGIQAGRETKEQEYKK